MAESEHQRLVKGTTNASTLMEKITRTRIYNSVYWNESCFGLTEETLVDRAVELTHVGGTYGGNRRPTPFLCLVLKMLQMKPDPSIALEFIRQEDHKYARALGVYYWRLVATPGEAYRELEPLLRDYRKLRVRVVGGWELSTVDQFVETLLMASHSCDIALPSMPPRATLERAGTLSGPRQSTLQNEFDQLRRAGANPGAPGSGVAALVGAGRGRKRRSEENASYPSSSSSSGPAAKRARPADVDLGEIIEITCNDRLGKKIRVKCHENALIIDVKKLAAAQLGTRPGKIRFQKWHSILKDHIRLSDYEIREGANIELYYQ